MKVDYVQGWNRGAKYTKQWERERVIEFVNERISTHFGCHGLRKGCARCILLRQVIEFVENKPE